MYLQGVSLSISSGESQVFALILPVFEVLYNLDSTCVLLTAFSAPALLYPSCIFTGFLYCRKNSCLGKWREYSEFSTWLPTDRPLWFHILLHTLFCSPQCAPGSDAGQCPCSITIFPSLAHSVMIVAQPFSPFAGGRLCLEKQSEVCNPLRLRAIILLLLIDSPKQLYENM